MMRWLNPLPVLLSLVLLGCTTGTTPKSTALTAQQEIPSNLAQQLPIAAEIVLKDGGKIQLEVATTPEQLQKGLMYRPPLPDNLGMLFIFPYPRQVRFWMKNVPVPLDMVFLQDNEIKYIQPSAPPCPEEPCPTYGVDSNVLINRVIELRSGRVSELNWQNGDRLDIKFLDPSLSKIGK